MANTKWGEGELAPLATRKELRAQRRADEKDEAFSAAQFLKDVKEAEQNGERGVERQIAAGGTPGATITADDSNQTAPPAPPAAPPVAPAGTDAASAAAAVWGAPPAAPAPVKPKAGKQQG